MGELLALVPRLLHGLLLRRNVGTPDDDTAFGSAQPFDRDLVPAWIITALVRIFQTPVSVEPSDCLAHTGEQFTGEVITGARGAFAVIEVVVAEVRPFEGVRRGIL